MRAVRQTGRALAADRATKFLPIIVAQTFFIGAVGIAIFRTAAAAGHSASSDTVFINVEAHSIAFTAQYFWIIPAVFLSSIIGVSQTEAAIPRILRRFQKDLDRLNLPQAVQMPESCLNDDQGRIFHGGIYSWLPSNRQSNNYSSLSGSLNATYPPSTNATGYGLLGRGSPAPENEQAFTADTSDPLPSDNLYKWLPYPILVLGTVTGMIVSGLVPPDGFDCRHIAQILICAAWVFSAQLNILLDYLWPLRLGKTSMLFWMTALKDLLITAATMGGVVVTQLGIFNRCSCYTLWSKTGLALPQRPDVAATLFTRLNTVYPAVTFTGIGIELVIVPLVFCIRYPAAIRVFVQRDDRRSNAEWLWNMHRKLQTLASRISTLPSCFPLERWRPHRRGTSSFAVEQGVTSESMELQTPLTRTIFAEPEEVPEEGANASHEAHGPTYAITSISQSESSSVQAPLPSRTNSPSRSEPRRRNTEPQWSRENEAPVGSRSQDDQPNVRKPIPVTSPL